MWKFFVKITRVLLKRFDIAVIRQGTLEQLLIESGAQQDLDVILKFAKGDPAKFLEVYESSRSQLRQDLFVLSHFNYKRHGFFVEFGATNGVDLSNTHLMETQFGWTGILAEPARCWHEDLKKNRSCVIDTNCVWRDSRSKLTFNEVDVAELSTIHEYSDVDTHGDSRRFGRFYNVDTISLNDLLEKHGAPIQIDYLSIDTEGSEFEILKNFNFSKYSISVITCEHNYTPMRDKIYELLIRNGYKRVHEEISKFDDWYIKQGLS